MVRLLNRWRPCAFHASSWVYTPLKSSLWNFISISSMILSSLPSELVSLILAIPIRIMAVADFRVQTGFARRG